LSLTTHDFKQLILIGHDQFEIGDVLKSYQFKLTLKDKEVLHSQHFHNKL